MVHRLDRKHDSIAHGADGFRTVDIILQTEQLILSRHPFGKENDW